MRQAEFGLRYQWRAEEFTAISSFRRMLSMYRLAYHQIGVAACGLVLLASTATSAVAQIRIDKDQTGRVVAIAGLPIAEGCIRGTATGRVVGRKLEKGELRGFTFYEPPYGDGYINLPTDYDIKDRGAYARVQAALNDLLRQGARLKISSVACGAAGRVIELVSATLIDDAPTRRAAPVAGPATRPAPAPSERPVPASAVDTGVKTDDGDDSVLRAPDGPAVAAATPPTEQPAPQPPKSVKEPATPQASSDEAVRWHANISARTAKVGIPDEGEYTTIWVECTRGSGRATMHVDAPGGRLKRGSRQQFQIAAGQDSFTVRGTARYDEVDRAMTIEATAGLDDIADILSLIERHDRFIIKTPGHTQPVEIGGARVAIPGFLTACSKRG